MPFFQETHFELVINLASKYLQGWSHKLTE